MTDAQWETLLAVMRGEQLRPLPVGFIIDSPWLPNWAGYTILDYFTDDRSWFDAHLKAFNAFPEAIFLPGFWSEYGMCTEPSAFGAKSVWEENEFPFAQKLITSVEEVDRIELPNPAKDGLLPFMLKRLKHLQPEIERAGHRIKFAVARGPLNIASFLMGATEFMTAIKTDPERIHRLLALITTFLQQWIALQRASFPSIDGLLVLDDIVGFISKPVFQEFGLPYLKKIYDLEVAVKFFHNDAPCKASASFYPEIGINLLNFGIQHTLAEMKAWTGNAVTLLGNIPPRDVLANGTPDEVRNAVAAILQALPDRARVIVSCGGGMPPGVSTTNLQAFMDAVKNY
jgi:uroporphyrinogen-III decarboxylase